MAMTLPRRRCAARRAGRLRRGDPETRGARGCRRVRRPASVRAATRRGRTWQPTSLRPRRSACADTEPDWLPTLLDRLDGSQMSITSHATTPWKMQRWERVVSMTSSGCCSAAPLRRHPSETDSRVARPFGCRSSLRPPRARGRRTATLSDSARNCGSAPACGDGSCCLISGA
jgi:hypothetical protein